MSGPKVTKVGLANGTTLREKRPAATAERSLTRANLTRFGAPSPSGRDSSE